MLPRRSKKSWWATLFTQVHLNSGSGDPAAAVIIAELSGKHFKNAAALASYAGLAPTTRQSGTSIKFEKVSHSGNKRLKQALFLSAFAIIALAHRRLGVPYAMIRDGSLYDQPKPALAASQTTQEHPRIPSHSRPSRINLRRRTPKPGRCNHRTRIKLEPERHLPRRSCRHRPIHASMVARTRKTRS